MALLGGLLSVKGVAYLSFSVFLVAAIGYALGKITIKGVNLGTAGVFIIALLFGCFFYDSLDAQLVIKGTETTYTGDALKVVENLGLIFFVTSVGFIAGPNFFGNLKKNFKSYVLLGLVIIAAASFTEPVQRRNLDMIARCSSIFHTGEELPLPEVATESTFAFLIANTKSFQKET